MMTILMSVLCLTYTDPLPAYASGFLKAYTIENKTIAVYRDKSLRVKIGAIFGNDEIRLNEISNKYCKVTYFITNSKYFYY